MPAPHHLNFYRPGALPDTQPTGLKCWRQLSYLISHSKIKTCNVYSTLHSTMISKAPRNGMLTRNHILLLVTTSAMNYTCLTSQPQNIIAHVHQNCIPLKGNLSQYYLWSHSITMKTVKSNTAQWRVLNIQHTKNNAKWRYFIFIYSAFSCKCVN